MMFPFVGGLGVMSNQASATVDNTSTDLANVPPPLVTTVTDAKGKSIATLYQQYRIPTASDQISDAMKWALISIEDKRFNEHNGVDWKGTVRAAISNTQGGDTQGASTLTQQYVKNYLINVVYWNDNNPKHLIGRQKAQEQTIARKLKEARIAVQLETKMSKKEILTGYLNIVEFSRRIFGVGAAARAYFGVSAKQLDAGQGALLAGMVNNPTALDPWNNPEEAKDRRNVVLDQMVGNNKLSEEDAEKIKEEPLGVLPGGPRKPPANCVGAGPDHGFFCQYVEDYLLRAGMDENDLYTGGYTIRTTLDREANKLAKDSAEFQVPKTEPNVANTLSLVKPGKKRHKVVALAANKDYGPDKSKGQTVYALPSDVKNLGGGGSTFKIFTAAAAMQEGVTGIHDKISAPNFHISPVFISGSPQEACPNTEQYCVQNYPGSSFGSSITLQDALAKSPNTAFVILEEKAGMGPVVKMAEKLGLRRSMAANGKGLSPDPKAEDNLLSSTQSEIYGPNGLWPGSGSFTLGPAAVSGLELANVAATIMSGGMWCPPSPIAEVTDRNGNSVKIQEEPCERVIPKGLADTLAVGLSKDHTGGTATGAASQVGWDRPMIGKTGTAQNAQASTFVGATPQLAGAAMVFRPDSPIGSLCYAGPGNVRACDLGTGNMQGARTPAATWFDAMIKIHENLPKKDMPKPDPRYTRMNGDN
ncbi:MAG: penicillin-binding protein [Actinophytocola sp.]|nr:penicillin-binding protein [Actinophytocola sp.]